MLFKNLKSLITNAVLILVMLSGMLGSTISANAEAVSSPFSDKGLSKLGSTSKLDGDYSGSINLADWDHAHRPVFSSKNIKPFTSLLTANSFSTPSEYLITTIDNPRAMFGFSVNSAGDVNGDGFDDVIIGAREYWEGESAEGAAFLYLGSSSGEFSAPAWSVQSNQSFAAMGGSVDTAGDVNGDGYDDILVGAFQYTLGEVGEGTVFAYYGSPSGPSTTPDWIGQINQAGAKYGWSVSNAGDVNNDGYDDVIIGARYYSNGQTDEGKAFLYLGSATGLASVPAWSKEIDVQNAGFGYSVSDAGDVNGDGYDDVLVTSYNYIYAQLNGGKAYLFLGKPDGLSATASWIGESTVPMDGYGQIGAYAGDVNNDGYSDILIGAPAGDNDTVNGKAYLYFGSANGPSQQPDWFAQGTTTGLFGFSLASAGDYNHDGYDDILVGDPIYYTYPSIGGAVFLYLGGSSVPSAQPYLSYTSGVNNSAFANVVGSAGQFNGDIYDDFLVGAPMWTNGYAAMFFGRGTCAASSITVTNTNDSGVGSLRQVIADVCSGGTLNFASSLSGQTITLTSTLIIDKNLTIDGSALPSHVIISGDMNNDGYGDVQVFHVNSGVTATLNDLTISKGQDLLVDGGGISNFGVLTVSNSTFSSNSSDYGGGIFNNGTLTVSNSTFSDNSAYYGGGISNFGTLTVTNSTFSGNSSTYGGGIYNYKLLTMFNSTISGNSALATGGGIFNRNSGGNMEVLKYANTIIANSTSGGDCFVDLAGGSSISTNLNNLVGDGSCSTGGVNFKTGDPALDSLADNGGHTQTMALLPNSPAINAGDEATCAAAPVNGLDQRGVARPQGSHCDIGAFEFENTTPIITSNGGGSTASVNVAENNTSVTTVTATDADLPTQTLSYSISGGVDASFFKIDSTTGALTFLSAPNYEAPADHGTNNVYDVTVQVSDAIGGTDIQAIAVAVTNVNEAPTNISLSNTTVNENQAVSTLVGTLSTTDVDSVSFTYSLTLNGSACPAATALNSSTFQIGGTSNNELQTTVSLDYETQSSYVICIRTNDGDSTFDKPFTITVNNLDEDTPTVASIVRADPNPTAASSVDFTVTFSEPVTGVDKTDFSLTSLGIVGTSIMTVNGSGTVYAVSVDTGTGNGTIRLDVVDDDSIQDTSYHPLGGSGLGNGNYISGEKYTKLNGGDATGVFRPSNGLLYLKNQNTSGFADLALNYGIPGDYPVVGDWDGNGTTTIGIYRNGSFYLRNSNSIGFADLIFAFGQAGDQPIAGDWDGDGVDTIGVYRPSNGQFLLRNRNSAGAVDISFFLGNVGDVGIAGDWDGDGKDTTGVFRPSNGVIFLKDKNESGFADVALNYGNPGDKPVTGDWDNDGIDTIGVDRNGIFYLRNENTNGFAEIVFGLGNPGDMPIAGNWDGLP